MDSENQPAGVPRYPVEFSVDYPDRPLNRLTTAFRIFTAIPILIVLGSIGGGDTRWDSTGHTSSIALGGTVGVLFLPPLLMILFRQKYPRWWFDWNVEVLRFSSRVAAYLALMDDHYPSTDEQQSVRLELAYPDAKEGLNRWLPLVKWLLAIPHFIVVGVLSLVAILAVICAWFAILITGRYPRPLFNFVLGVLRWGNRVVGYAIVLVTDEYPPFRLSA
jgi:hypothetical protein